ncbi:CotH kinase family protein [Demequina sp. B12]|uniref:CotH kinase family protein n=1 Tax=Demequina sp. B12 TaxID=2992757 RepID=UPI00237B226E|nr:CotH kinase family protein [Demequina sp. B12]MDE0571896.1 CotH kinase family protein [Demequina sp. B12]
MTSPRTFKISAVIASLTFAAACTAPTDSSAPTDGTASNTGAAVAADQASVASSPEVWDSNDIHEFTITYDQGDYDSLVAAYLESGDKEWISATVTIDGETYQDAGLKLKGNSSLRGMTEADAASPQDLPWIINLDKFVDGQDHHGAEEFVIRSNTSQTALNEAVALDLLDAAGLAAEEAIAATVTMNGSDESLRLVVENPNTDWMERELGNGYLWKAESGGTWDYVGEDQADYVDSFDQEGGDDNYTALIDFLDFINNADDATFASDLSTWLDVDAFATYLAFQTVINNFDDIDGPGNNAYLYWDIEDQQMTVVNWDLNLAFGASNGGPMGGDGEWTGGGERPGNGEWAGGDAPGGQAPGGLGGLGGGEASDLGGLGDGSGLGDASGLGDGSGDRPMPGAGETPPEGITLPEGMDLPTEGVRGGFGGMNQSSILSERFLAVEDFSALVDAETARLTQELFESGLAGELLEDWSSLLTSSATDLIPAATVDDESAALEEQFPA